MMQRAPLSVRDEYQARWKKLCYRLQLVEIVWTEKLHRDIYIPVRTSFHFNFLIEFIKWFRIRVAIQNPGILKAYCIMQ